MIAPGPKNQEEYVAGLRSILSAGFPITCRGAGTGLSGGSVPSENAIVVGTALLRDILQEDLPNRLARVAPGVINLALSRHVAHSKLCYAPDPSSQRTCTIGGNVAENSGGPHCLKYGVTGHHLLGASILLPKSKDRVLLGGEALDPPGYDLLSLLCGSEGTLAPLLDLTVKLTPVQPESRTLLAVFSEISAACEAVTQILESGVIPAALEMIDRLTISAVEQVIQAGYPSDADAVLLIELDGLEESLDEQVETIKKACAGLATSIRLAQSASERALLWRGRKEAVGALGKLAPNYYIQDGVLPRSKLPELFPKIKAIGDKHGLQIANVFHAGDGNLHPVILFDRKKEGQVQAVIKAGTEILKACVEAGGTITGEHGMGLEKRHAFGLLFTKADLALFEKIKAVFDPDSLMNPGKIAPVPGACLEGGRKARVFDVSHDIPNPLPMKTLLVSAEERELQDRIAVAREARGKLLIGGHGSWQGLDAQGAQLLHCPESFNGIVDYSPKDLVITVGCGTALKSLRPTLAEHKQLLPLLMPFGDQGTVGGCLGTRPGGGHRRPGHGSARERLIALRFISGTGELHKSGTQVAKNVAGYDLPRLLLGSRGTLGLSLEASFQVIPKRPGESLRVTGAVAKIEALCEWLVQSQRPWVGLTVLNCEASQLLFPETSEDGWTLIVGLEDSERACKAVLGMVKDSPYLRECELQNYQGPDHETLWETLDAMPGTVRESLPTWQRLHTTGTESLGTLIRGVPRGTPATTRRLCGMVDMYFPATHDLGRKVSYSSGRWLRQLTPWRPALECSGLSPSLRSLFRDIKGVFDPDSIFPSLLGEEDHV
ncbi:MAG: FAD-linked oxidase C-terminal domain-containing protein [Planctomycetota bacterium]|nr:FAD-linked oxidase C-terminal domain-containing protein [Planctomycetota bacterium]